MTYNKTPVSVGTLMQIAYVVATATYMQLDYVAS